MRGFLVLAQDFKFDLNAYLAARPTAPVRTLEEVLTSGKYHPAVETALRNSQNVESRDTKEYLEHVVKRDTLRLAILKAMADNRVDALAYPTIRRKAMWSARRSWARTATSAPILACPPSSSPVASLQMAYRSGRAAGGWASRS